MKIWDEEDAASWLRCELPEWRISDGWVLRKYQTKGWQDAMLLAGAIGHLCETAWHHPDLLIAFGRVEVRLLTHTPKGITDKDLMLAKKNRRTGLLETRKTPWPRAFQK